MRRCLGEPKEIREFVNRYYSLAESDRREDWVLRTRQEAQELVLTLKIGREISPGVFDSIEYSAKVFGDTGDWEGTEPMRRFRQEISQGAVSLQGEMRNRREIYRPAVEVGRAWELDLAILPSGEQFSELEVEVVVENDSLPVLRERLEGWIRECGVEPRPSTETKYARFLKALRAG